MHLLCARARSATLRHRPSPAVVAAWSGWAGGGSANDDRPGAGARRHARLSHRPTLEAMKPNAMWLISSESATGVAENSLLLAGASSLRLRCCPHWEALRARDTGPRALQGTGVAQPEAPRGQVGQWSRGCTRSRCARRASSAELGRTRYSSRAVALSNDEHTKRCRLRGPHAHCRARHRHVAASGSEFPGKAATPAS